MTAQKYSNHARYDPKFHFFLIPLCVICFLLALAHANRQPTPPNLLLIPVTFAVFLGFFIARLYALHNQDRIIRLEEQLRMQRLGVDAEGLSLRQLVALRFASDAELPALAARARAEGLDSKAIKQAIQTWRADTFRI